MFDFFRLGLDYLMQDYLSCIKIFFVILLGVLFKSQEFDNALSPEPVGENENNKLNLDRGEITYQDQTLEGKNVLEKGDNSFLTKRTNELFDIFF